MTSPSLTAPPAARVRTRSRAAPRPRAAPCAGNGPSRRPPRISPRERPRSSSGRKRAVRTRPARPTETGSGCGCGAAAPSTSGCTCRGSRRRARSPRGCAPSRSARPPAATRSRAARPRGRGTRAPPSGRAAWKRCPRCRSCRARRISRRPPRSERGATGARRSWSRSPRRSSRRKTRRRSRGRANPAARSGRDRNTTCRRRSPCPWAAPSARTRDAKGRPLLFLHPHIGMHGSQALIDALARHAQVIAPSHPGFGNSELPKGMSTVDDMSYFYLDLIEELGLRDLVVVCASFCGWIGAEIATKTCERLSRLVLIGAVRAKFRAPDNSDIVDIFSTPRARWEELSFRDPAVWLRDYESLPRDELTAMARHREATALFAWNPYMYDPKLKARLHLIRIPTLLLWGAHDGLG